MAAGSVCDSYDDCLAKAEKIGNNSLRKPLEEALARDMSRRAVSLAEKDSAEYFYDLARYYSWDKSISNRDILQKIATARLVGRRSCRGLLNVVHTGLLHC